MTLRDPFNLPNLDGGKKKGGENFMWYGYCPTEALEPKSPQAVVT